VLEKIAEMLDDMHSPPSQLNRTTQPVELTVAVTFQASLCDLEDEVKRWTYEGRQPRLSRTQSIIAKTLGSTTLSPTECRLRQLNIGPSMWRTDREETYYVRFTLGPRSLLKRKARTRPRSWSRTWRPKS